MCVAVLCLYVAAVSLAAPALRYADRYSREVLADDPNLYLKFDHEFPFDSSLYPYPRVGYIKTYGNESEPNDGTKIVKAGGIGKNILLDSSTRDGGQGHGGVYVLANRHTTEASSYGGIGDEFSFAGDVYPASLSFEFWYKTLPQGQPQPEDNAQFFHQIGSFNREPRAPGIAALRADANSPAYFRVLGGPKFWYTGVEAPYDGNWHHVVLTYEEEYDSQPDTMRMELYLDGEIRAVEVHQQSAGEVLVNRDFETGAVSPWELIANGTLAVDDIMPNDGSQYCAKVSGRTAATDGIKQSILGKLTPGHTYEIGGLMAAMSSGTRQPLYLFIQQTDDSGTQRIDILEGNTTGAWITFGMARFTYNPDGDVTELYLGVDGPAAGRDLYVDGPLIGGPGTVPVLQAIPARMGPELIGFTVGGLNDWGWLYNCFNGHIDEVAVYGGILSGERVKAHYDAWQPQSCEEIWARGNPDDGFINAYGAGSALWTIPSGENVGMLSDLNQDCYVDLADFALMATDWAKCTTPGGAGCETPWQD